MAGQVLRPSWSTHCQALPLFQPTLGDLGVDQVPGPPQEGQLMCTLISSTHHDASNTIYVILPVGASV